MRHRLAQYGPPSGEVDPITAVERDHPANDEVSSTGRLSDVRAFGINPAVRLHLPRCVLRESPTNV